ncbi:hypothetical protein BDV12DRAFT_169148 [Aspergillus spectabilis]
MFSSKPPAPSISSLAVNTSNANSIFNVNNTQTPATSASTTAQPVNTTGSVFGNLGVGNKPAQSAGSSMFPGVGTQQSNNGSGGLFNTASTAPQQTGGLLSSTTGTNNTTTQPGNTGGLFGTLGAGQAQSKPMFSLGVANPTGGVFGTTNQPTGASQNLGQQQQQPNKPTLSLFGNQNSTAQQPAQQTATAAGPGTVVPGVKVDLSNLLPTTKYESCADEVKSELERFDTIVFNQIKMCNEVANMVPSIVAQGSTIPYDVEYVQGKLETVQHALENDASDIDQLRNLVSRDAAEAQVAFRAIDTLKLPLQYQSTGGSGWWSAQDQKVSDPQSLRSMRKNTLALPDDVEGEPSANTINGVPVNLVDYFSQRSDEMSVVLERYTRNLKEIEDHLHGVESTLERQIHDFTTSRSRDSTGTGAPKSVINDLAAVLSDVEAGILGVAGHLGTVTEQAQEVVLGAPSGLEGRRNF